MDLSRRAGRREALRSGIGLAAAGIVVPKVIIPKFVLLDPAEERDQIRDKVSLINRLCDATCNNSSALSDDFLESDEPDSIIRAASADDPDLPSQVQHFAWMNRVDYFARHTKRVTEAIRQRLRAGPATWAKTEVWLQPLLASFFGDRATVDNGDTGFVLVIPWYITTRHSFSLRHYEVMDGIVRLPESKSWLAQPRFATPRPASTSLALDLRGLEMRPPVGRKAEDVSLTVRLRERVYRDVRGRVVGSDWVLQYGVAGPDDRASLERGDYYPNSADVRRRGYTKATVVVLGRIPKPAREGRVIPLAHQASLSFDISGQVLNDINTLVRDADRFIDQYPGLLARMRDLLRK